MFELQPFSLLVGAVIGVGFICLSDVFIERQARNREMRKAAREKRQC